ncbi:MAG TPA: hypothetical protein DCM86_07840 [Verrucomicrobiales bacterium]|nr:hypothetical protein [Verrucomicrobiales bacterium]
MDTGRFTKLLARSRMALALAACAASISIYTAAPGAAAGEVASEAKPWLIPPHVLEFVGPVAQLFGTNSAFGARVMVSHAGDPKEVKPAGGTLLFRDGSTIYEPDSAPVRGPSTKSRKERDGDFGLLVVSLLPQKMTYVVSEGVSGYTEVPFGKPEGGPYGVAEKEVGRERVQGFDCIKLLVVVQPDVGDPQSFFVWRAPKLRGFPLRIERTKGGPGTIFAFSNVRFERPADSLFAQPDGYHHYDSLNAMSEEMTRRVWNVYRKPEQSIAFPDANIQRAGGTPGRRPGSY